MSVALTESLTCGREAPSQARRRVRLWCRDLDPEVRWNIELVVSELVTNAVVHGADPITLSVDINDAVMVVVADGGAGDPHLGNGGVDEEGGRGLALVADLVNAWGVRPDGDSGKEVWASIDSTLS